MEETAKSSKRKQFSLSSRRWFVLMAYFFLTFENFSTMYAFSSISNILQKYYSINMVAVNWLAMSKLLTIVVLTLTMAQFAENKGLRCTMVMAGGFSVLGSLVQYLGFSIPGDGYYILLAGSVLQAVSAASTIFLPSKIAAMWFGEKERATATAIAVAADCLGSGCSYLQPTAMVRNSDSHGTIRIELGLYLWVKVIEAVGIAAFLVLFVKDRPDQPPSGKESERRDLHRNQEAQGSPEKSDYVGSVPNEGTKHAEPSSPPTKSKDGSFSKPDEFLTDSKESLDAKHEGSVSNAGKHEESSSSSKSKDGCFAWLKEYKSLCQNRSFVIITLMNGIVYGLDETWLLVLNEVLIMKYPGHEVEIGTMVAASMVVGMCSNVAIGVILDYTQSFKLTTLIVTGLSSLVVTSFTILFIYRIHFSTLFISYVLLIGIHSAYFTIGFEHAAEMTYPVSENHSGVLLILIGQLSAVVFGRLASAVIYRHGPIAFLYTATGLYFLTFFLALWIKNKGPRTDYAPLETKH